MLTKLLENDTNANTLVPKEGDLFKIIDYRGQRFEIRHGYYEEQDRRFEPMAIYPDFIRNPVYTDNGEAFVTAMQQPCEQFGGKKDEDSACGDCLYYRKYEDLLGICSCSKTKIHRSKTKHS